ncbi:hypothetical protein Golomagni_05970 [Golovinomyces magnicellulatus]|nr:hypothetical protein Golomagni_05970 [Golovinomyces magnicellulatus]
MFKKWASTQWQHRWIANRKNSTAATWKTPWKTPPLKFYDGFKKYEATTLMLLRSEVIGLKKWLTSIKVPDINPQCTCGEHSQTVKHILLYCPEHSVIRARMIKKLI